MASKGKPAPPALGGKGAGKATPKGYATATAEPKKSWAAPLQITLKHDNGETLSRFKDAGCYTSAEVLDAAAIDWSALEDVAVIKGSLEVEESMTGIVLVQVGGKLVGFRNICDGRGANPVKEYFALILNQLLNGRAGHPENLKIRLASYRVAHLFANCDEYEDIRMGLRTCIQNKTGLKGLVDETEDDNPAYWMKENPGFTDCSHDLVRVLLSFFAMSKKHAFGFHSQMEHTGRYDETITAQSVSPADRSRFNKFMGVMEVVKGLATMQDKMTLPDEVQFNLAMGLTRDDPKYVHRTHDNPLYNSACDSVRAKLLWAMGKLTAYDALVNNWDRLSVSLLWDNKGNLTNIVVEKGTFEVVGIDQCVNPIDAGAGLDTYRKRLGTLVGYVKELTQNGFEDPELDTLDTSGNAEIIIQSIIDWETMLETRSQARIMGKGLLEQHWELSREEHRHKWLQDLQKTFIKATGVYLELRFLAKHFVRGMADGFSGLALSGDEGEALLRDVLDKVEDAFDHTNEEKLDLRGNIRSCTDFVRGNAAVISSYFQA